ncbi:hypothetical protein BC940DRAFT_309852 [Gongronella butleri]|nr:hypothetical protein BC940DRAFT_309852 [Gongronella butleri]
MEHTTEGKVIKRAFFLFGGRFTRNLSNCSPKMTCSLFGRVAIVDGPEFRESPPWHRFC